MNMYTVLVLDKSSAQIIDLAPGTAYLFKVQPPTLEGVPWGSGMEDEFETMSERNTGKQGWVELGGGAI